MRRAQAVLTRKKGLKRRHRAIGAPTADQQVHQDRQRASGCAMCLLLRKRPPNTVRIHHRTTGDLHGQKQLGQDATVGLCDWHHQGVPLRGMQEEAMRAAYGPSLHHHKRDFVNLLDDLLGERSTAALQRFQDDLLA